MDGTVAELTTRVTTLREDAGASAPEHPDIARWRTATDADNDAIHAVVAAADAVDHPTWITPREDIADTFDVPHIDHTRDTILALDAAGTVVAFGSAFLHPSRAGALTSHLGGAVHPDLRRRGIGSVVMAWQRARGLEQIAEALASLDAGDDAGVAGEAERWTADLKAYAEESQPGQQAIAVGAGLTPERWFTTMERDMGVAVPAVSVAGQIALVPYTHDRDDDARLARNDAFRDHWGSLPSQPETWGKFVGGAFFRPDLSRLAVAPDGAVVGFCLASVNEDDWVALGASSAYIDLIGVVRSHRRRGIAPAVIAATLDAIAAAGLERAMLDVDTASPTGANALYENLGFRATDRQIAFVLHL
ncbi:GNAT family N-acetyltransferase [Microbacterium flavum]|uniref:GNAT family N-acetyltransferase n=1 Tax=Microbacterium flavum TaxID=415216 RepID=A0ABS5XUE4_9MICO|nr:GNAT family N-acetyltransferase [Microbacterium flavum]MBT8797556.1 GNAT family N-acetyltransferase [Microbacterium flavum]